MTQKTRCCIILHDTMGSVRYTSRLGSMVWLSAASYALAVKGQATAGTIYKFAHSVPGQLDIRGIVGLSKEHERNDRLCCSSTKASTDRVSHQLRKRRTLGTVHKKRCDQRQAQRQATCDAARHTAYDRSIF